MRQQIAELSDIEALDAKVRNIADAKKEKPRVLTMSELMKLEMPTPSNLIGDYKPRCGACLKTAKQKAGKTLLSVAEAAAIATNRALFSYYNIVRSGPTMIIEIDDPNGAASIKQILSRSKVPETAPIHFCDKVPFSLGPEFIDWLRGQIRSLGLVYIGLDSYTAARPARKGGGDIVKQEHAELTALDELGKETDCLIELIHHDSKGSSALDWSAKAGGTFAMTMATEGQMNISRFDELPMNAPERLVRMMARHLKPLEMVLRFREDTLDYEFIMEGSGSAAYPTLMQIDVDFGNGAFGPKELCMATGMSRAQAHRHIAALLYGGHLQKIKFGEYRLTRGNG